MYKSPEFHTGWSPVAGYRPDPKKRYNLYIHFRESENRWVIDDTVAYTGGVLYYSQDNRPLEQTKFEKRMISSTNTVNVKVKKIACKNPRAYNSEAVSVEGFGVVAQGLGSVCSVHDDGAYLRLPPQEDINGKPHYYKEGEHPRHLYFVIRPEKNLIFWAIAKTCNAEVMGACAYTESKKIGDTTCDFTTSNYKYYPPNNIEKDLRIKVVRPEDDLAAVVAALASTPSVGNTANISSALATKSPSRSSSSSSSNNNNNSSSSSDISAPSTSMQIDESNDLPESYYLARYEQTQLKIELARWKDSNHECVFFNNDTGIVSFLSLDKEVLKNNLHPVLLKHLESNNINVGEDLKNVNDTDRYWQILSAVTGVKHTREDAARVYYFYCITFYSSSFLFTYSI